MIAAGDSILAPGRHIVALETCRTCPPAVLAQGLERIGFRDVVIDRKPAQTDSLIAQTFAAHALTPLELRDTPAIAWKFHHPLVIDPPEEIVREFRMFDLEPGKTYEALFLSRLWIERTRDSVWSGLSSMGFVPLAICMLKHDVRLASRPDASLARWIGVLRWNGPRSPINALDPFFFEQIIEVT